MYSPSEILLFVVILLFCFVHYWKAHQKTYTDQFHLV